MPYYSPTSEQAAYCWNQCIRFSPRQFGETLESDMTYFLDVLYTNISTSSAEEFYNSWNFILSNTNYPDKMGTPNELEAFEIGKSLLDHLSLTQGSKTHVAWMSSPKVII
jgi:hypothetical protein